MNLKEEIRKITELKHGVDLTPKKMLETKKDFLDALDHFEKSLDEFIIDHKDIDDDDDFNNDIASRNNERIDLINSLLTDIKLELRYVWHLI